MMEDIGPQEKQIIKKRYTNYFRIRINVNIFELSINDINEENISPEHINLVLHIEYSKEGNHIEKNQIGNYIENEETEYHIENEEIEYHIEKDEIEYHIEKDELDYHIENNQTKIRIS